MKRRLINVSPALSNCISVIKC